jgi:iron complex outermembrane receptor protein
MGFGTRAIFLAGLATGLGFGATPASADTGGVEPISGSAEAAAGSDAPQPVAEEAGSGDIVVTARRRAETLQEVPLAVSVIGGEALRDSGVTQTGDLYGRVPSLYFTNAQSASPASDFTYLVLRGIGFNGGQEPAAGVFIDGMYQPQMGFDIGFLDLERLEVLRGPQGTLFGRNTQAGAVNLVTRRPGRDPSGRLEAEAGSDETWRLFGSLSGPIAGNLSAGLAAEHQETAGYLRNTTLDRDAAPSRRSSVRGALRFNPGNLDLMLTGDYSRRTGNEAGFGVAYGCKCYDIRDDEYVPDRKTNAGIQLNAELKLSGRLTLASITGYRDVDSDNTIDFDAKPTVQTTVTANGHAGSRIAPGTITYGGFSQHMVVSQDIFSQELRLNYSDSSLDALVGGYYFSQSQRQFRQFSIGPGVVTAPAVAVLVPLVVLEDYLTDRNGTAIFGQASWRPASRLELTLGGRYSHENVRIDGERERNIFKIENANPQFFRPQGEKGFSNFSWTASAAYHFRPGSQIYATVARGWKSGGFSRFPGAPNAVLPYDSETSTNYELGLKSSWLRGRLIANLAAFYIDIKDQQLSTVIRDASGVPVSTIANAGSSRSKGLEAEIFARPSDRLSLSASASYTDARFTDFRLCSSLTNCVDMAGRHFDSVPAWLLGATADYRIPLAGGASLTLFGEYRYVDRVEVNEITFTSPLGARLPIPAYDRVNLRVSYEKDRWKLTAFVNNLLDSYDYSNTTYQLFEPRTAQNQLVQPLAPRTFGLIAAYRF